MSEKPIYEELEQRVKELEKAANDRLSSENHLKLLSLAVNQGSEGIAVADMDGNLEYLNNAFADMHGYSAEELVGKNLSIFHTPEQMPHIEATNLEMKQKGSFKGEIWHVKRDGTVFPTIMHNSLIRDETNKPIGMMGTLRDITDIKQSEEALLESEERYRRIFENLQDVYYEAGMDKTILEVSPSIEKLSQYKRKELIGKSLYDIYTDQKEREGFLKLILDKGKVNDYEIHLKDKDGSQRLCSINTLLMRDSQGTPVKIIGSIRDISEKKQAEEALRKSEEKLARSKKMESLGLLAGGIAHDLNNVLSGIVSYPELILMDLPEDSKLRKPIEIMQESGHRAADIVQDLLTMARGIAATKEPLNLNDTVSNYLNSPEFKKLEQFHPTVTIKTNLDNDLLNVAGSPVHMKKVVMNLVSNAYEAIEDGGNVTISTMNRSIDKPLKGYDDVNIGEYAVLAVSDDGSGISSDDLERIFEPFYTKKMMGRSGTGLGLAVVWNTVQDHKGYIDVNSDKNGTTFELYFRITRDKMLDKDLSIPIKDYKGNGETILVVDDVESQRDISSKMLDTLGYKTKAVSSGEEAVEYLKENTVDLILLDMIMDPGINGLETYERIIKIHPKQKAIIVSGFAETNDVKKAQKLGAGKYIKKPVVLEKIGLGVKEELEKTAFA